MDLLEKLRAIKAKSKLNNSTSSDDESTDDNSSVSSFFNDIQMAKEALAKKKKLNNRKRKTNPAPSKLDVKRSSVLQRAYNASSEFLPLTHSTPKPGQNNTFPASLSPILIDSDSDDNVAQINPFNAILERSGTSNRKDIKQLTSGNKKKDIHKRGKIKTYVKNKEKTAKNRRMGSRQSLRLQRSNKNDDVVEIVNGNAEIIHSDIRNSPKNRKEIARQPVNNRDIIENTIEQQDGNAGEKKTNEIQGLYKNMVEERNINIVGDKTKEIHHKTEITRQAVNNRDIIEETSEQQNGNSEGEKTKKNLQPKTKNVFEQQNENSGSEIQYLNKNAGEMKTKEIQDLYKNTAEEQNINVVGDKTKEIHHNNKNHRMEITRQAVNNRDIIEKTNEQQNGNSESEINKKTQQSKTENVFEQQNKNSGSEIQYLNKHAGEMKTKEIQDLYKNKVEEQNINVVNEIHHNNKNHRMEITQQAVNNRFIIEKTSEQQNGNSESERNKKTQQPTTKNVFEQQNEKNSRSEIQYLNKHAGEMKTKEIQDLYKNKVEEQNINVINEIHHNNKNHRMEITQQAVNNRFIIEKTSEQQNVNSEGEKNKITQQPKTKNVFEQQNENSGSEIQYLNKHDVAENSGEMKTKEIQGLYKNKVEEQNINVVNEIHHNNKNHRMEITQQAVNNRCIIEKTIEQQNGNSEIKEIQHANEKVAEREKTGVIQHANKKLAEREKTEVIQHANKKLAEREKIEEIQHSNNDEVIDGNTEGIEINENQVSKSVIVQNINEDHMGRNITKDYDNQEVSILHEKPEGIEQQVLNLHNLNNSVIPEKENEQQVLNLHSLNNSVTREKEIEQQASNLHDLNNSVTPVTKIEQQLLNLHNLNKSVTPENEIGQQESNLLNLNNAVSPEKETVQQVLNLHNINNFVTPKKEIERQASNFHNLNNSVTREKEIEQQALNLHNLNNSVSPEKEIEQQVLNLHNLNNFVSPEKEIEPQVYNFHNLNKFVTAEKESNLPSDDVLQNPTTTKLDKLIWSHPKDNNLHSEMCEIEKAGGCDISQAVDLKKVRDNSLINVENIAGSNGFGDEHGNVKSSSCLDSITKSEGNTENITTSKAFVDEEEEKLKTMSTNTSPCVDNMAFDEQKLASTNVEKIVKLQDIRMSKSKLVKDNRNVEIRRSKAFGDEGSDLLEHNAPISTNNSPGLEGICSLISKINEKSRFTLTQSRRDTQSAGLIVNMNKNIGPSLSKDQMNEDTQSINKNNILMLSNMDIQRNEDTESVDTNEKNVHPVSKEASTNKEDNVSSQIKPNTIETGANRKEITNEKNKDVANRAQAADEKHKDFEDVESREETTNKKNKKEEPTENVEDVVVENREETLNKNDEDVDVENKEETMNRNVKVVDEANREETTNKKNIDEAADKKNKDVEDVENREGPTSNKNKKEEQTEENKEETINKNIEDVDVKNKEETMNKNVEVVDEANSEEITNKKNMDVANRKQVADKKNKNVEDVENREATTNKKNKIEEPTEDVDVENKEETMNRNVEVVDETNSEETTNKRNKDGATRKEAADKKNNNVEDVENREETTNKKNKIEEPTEDVDVENKEETINKNVEDVDLKNKEETINKNDEDVDVENKEETMNKNVEVVDEANREETTNKKNKNMDADKNNKNVENREKTTNKKDEDVTNRENATNKRYKNFENVDVVATEMNPSYINKKHGEITSSDLTNNCDISKNCDITNKEKNYDKTDYVEDHNSEIATQFTKEASKIMKKKRRQSSPNLVESNKKKRTGKEEAPSLNNASLADEVNSKSSKSINKKDEVNNTKMGGGRGSWRNTSKTPKRRRKEKFSNLNRGRVNNLIKQWIRESAFAPGTRSRYNRIIRPVRKIFLLYDEEEEKEKPTRKKPQNTPRDPDALIPIDKRLINKRKRNQPATITNGKNVDSEDQIVISEVKNIKRGRKTIEDTEWF